MAPKIQEKKGGLTLEKLASYDDVITDALVDKVYYWTTIRKNRGGRFSALRGLQEEDIADILRDSVVLDKDPAEAVKRLLQLPGLRKFVAALKNDKEKEHFTRHLLRYVKTYMPDCPFEVTTTNRYTISDHEASVTARREIFPREEIKYLTGVQVAMTEEQEKTLELQRKDFSLVISSRKKTRSLFLGPARFANHDCDANARLTTKGYDGMQIVAVKHIDVGDEITVSYGEDYFGDDNEECLCQTCEDRGVNGWAPFKPAEEDEETETFSPKNSLEDGSPFLATKKRKHDDASVDASPDSTPASKRTRTGRDDEAPSRSPLLSPAKRRLLQPLRESPLKKAYSTSSLRQEIPVTSIEDSVTTPEVSSHTSRDIRNQQRFGLLTVAVDDEESSRGTTPLSSTTVAGSPESTDATDATSIDEDTTMAFTHVKGLDILKPSLGVATVKTETSTVKTALPTLFDDDASSDLSELSASDELDDMIQQVVKRKRPKTPPAMRATRSQSNYAEKNRIGTPVPFDPVEAGLIENTRKPGDYVRSDALLSAKYSKWVECNTCDDVFVQQNGYQTRKECPRCERHSKLYGFVWPKTDKEGKHDKEERILDHRIVNRFVNPGEEKTIRKTKRSLRDAIVERYSTPRSDFRESSISTIEPDSGRRGRRIRKTM